MLALFEVFARQYGAVFARSGGDHARLSDLERECWGADHA
jgi:hypothetical protein